jgi:DNA topoisomerase 2-associated protein PAT1
MRKAQAARQAQLQQGQQVQPPQQQQQHRVQPTQMMARQGSKDQAAIQALAQQAQMMSMRQQQAALEKAQAAPAQLSQQAQSVKPAQQQGDNLLAQLLASTPQGQQMQQAGLSLHDAQIKQTMEERMRANAAMEEARRRKAAKIHRMAKYNGVMTQGDKDFITRIQVSQLINSNGPNGTHDPYSDDFYYAVMQSMRQGRLAALQQQANAQAAGAGGPQQGTGLLGQQQHQQQQQQGHGRNRNNAAEKRMTRRENAMNRMTQQVQRLVDDAKKKPRASNCEYLNSYGPHRSQN